MYDVSGSCNNPIRSVNSPTIRKSCEDLQALRTMYNRSRFSIYRFAGSAKMNQRSLR
jgi:hypothetical protein